MLVDLSKSEQEVLDGIRNSEQYNSKDFSSNYFRLSGELSMVVRAAKIYILDNYKKVKDYSDLSLILRCANHEGTKYFGKKREKRPKKEGSGNRIISEMMRELDKERIEIKKFNEAVYDWSDGDFSVVFNGISYNWIDPMSVIEIASYIEERIKLESEI